MFLKLLLVLGIVFIVAIQARYDNVLSKHALDCITEVGTDEDTVRNLVTEKGIITEDQEVMEKFFGCCFKGYITDTNEFTVDDKVKLYLTKIFATRLDGRLKLARLLAEDCVDHCKTIKGDAKGKTAVKVFNCMMERLNEYIEKPTTE